MRIRLLLLALMMATLLVLPAVAGAAPGWRPPVAVETSPSASALSFPKIAARPSGCTTVAFERSDVVYASTRPADGSFSPIQNLGSILPSPTPEIAAGGGIVAATWPDPSSRIQVATAAGCDPLGAPAEVPGSYTFANQAAEVAVDSAGTALVAFEAGGSGSRRIYISERPAAGPPSEADDVAPPAGTEAFRPKLATNAGGGAGLVFDVVQSGSQVYGARRLGAGSWSAPIRLNAEGKPAVADSADAAVGPDGTLYCVWIDAGGKEVILGTLSPAGVVSRDTLIIAGGTVREPAIAGDADGRLAVIWAEQTAGGQARIYGKHREPGGALSAQRNVSSALSKFRGDPRVTIDVHGRTVAAWSEVASVGATQETYAATRTPGSDFYVGQARISGEALHTSPSAISTDAEGNTVVGLFVTSSPREAQVAAFDAAGPLLSDFSLPSGQVGASLPFSVNAVDAWSSPVGAQWHFGDGAGANGLDVAHSYAAGGSFGVTATVTDALGNASQASGIAAISAAPGGAVPDVPGGGGADGTPPRLTKLRLVPSRFPTAAGSKAPRIRFRLSERATVRFTVKPGGRRFKRRAKAGLNQLRLPARLRSLAAGAYRLRAVATDLSGNRSKPRIARFTVLPLA